MSLAIQLFSFGSGPASVCKCIVLSLRKYLCTGTTHQVMKGEKSDVKHRKITSKVYTMSHASISTFIPRTGTVDTTATWSNVHQFIKSVQILIDCFRSSRSCTVSQSQRLYMHPNWPHTVIILPHSTGIGEINLHPENLDLYGLKRLVVFQENCISVFLVVHLCLLLIQISWRIEFFYI